MKNQLKYNGYIHRAQFIDANNSEITIELTCRRAAPKGSGNIAGNTITRMRLVLDPCDVTAIAKAGAEGLRKLVEQAQGRVRSAQTWVEQLKSIAETA